MTDPTAFVDGTVHEPAQTEGPGLDLTVAGIREVTDPGRVDFGGGELEVAGLEALDGELRNRRVRVAEPDGGHAPHRVQRDAGALR